MFKSIIISVVVILSSLSTYSQNNGYYGKKNFVEVITVSHTPILTNIFGHKLRYKTNENSEDDVQIRNWVNGGIHMSIGRCFSPGRILSFEYGIDVWKQNARTFYRYADDIDEPYIWGTASEPYIMVASRFIPKIEFSSEQNLLPMGLTHQVGVGFTSLRILEKDYKVRISEQSIYDLPPSIINKYADDLVKYDVRFYGIQLLYSLKMRTPITKWLMVNYGVRYMIDIPISTKNQNPEYDLSIKRVAKDKNQIMFYNLFSLDVGLTVPF